MVSGPEVVSSIFGLMSASWIRTSALKPRFEHADGSPAQVFSAFNDKTVLRHFQWMKDYGIDGVFVQRFVADVSTPKGMRQCQCCAGSLPRRRQSLRADLCGHVRFVRHAGRRDAARDG